MEIILSHQAQKVFDKLNEPELSRVIKGLMGLAKDPPQGDIKKLSNRNDYRLRVGEIRIIYKINNETIYISHIANRGQAYKE